MEHGGTRKGREHLHSSHLKFEVSSVKRASSLGSGIWDRSAGKEPRDPRDPGIIRLFFHSNRETFRLESSGQTAAGCFFVFFDSLDSAVGKSRVDSRYIFQQIECVKGSQ